MKKSISLILVLLLVSGCTLTALAAQTIEIYQEEELFYMEVNLPNGARVAESTINDSLFITRLEYITEGKPSIVITVAPDEPYFGQNLSDLSKEEVELIIGGITLEMAEPSVDILNTPGGDEYIVANETTEDNDTCDTVMLADGYFIMVHVYYEDFSELTEDDMEIGPSIMDTLQCFGNTNS